MSTLKNTARLFAFASAFALAAPAFAVSAPALPSCDGDHGDKSDKKGEKNPSTVWSAPSCGGDHGDEKKGDKKGDDKA